MTVPRFRAARFVPIALGILAGACADNGPVEPVLPAIALPTSAAPAVRVGEEKIDSLAKGLAVVLGDVRLRMRVRDALRDSPFRSHAIDLGSYLRGTDGGELAERAATALGIGVDAFLTMVASTPNLELLMPRPLDRISWDGSTEIDLTATTANFRERREENRVSERGYEAGGNATSVATLRYSPRPYMILRPEQWTLPALSKGHNEIRAKFIGVSSGYLRLHQ